MSIIRLREVMKLTGLARSTIYKYTNAGQFPKPINLSGRSVGWVESEIHEWILGRIESRDQQSHEAREPETTD